MGFIIGIIGALILGAITGFGARAILPGAQDIGLPKTIGVGVIGNLIASIIFGAATHWIIGIILGALIGAGLLWLSIRQGWLKA